MTHPFTPQLYSIDSLYVAFIACCRSGRRGSWGQRHIHARAHIPALFIHSGFAYFALLQERLARFMGVEKAILSYIYRMLHFSLCVGAAGAVHGGGGGDSVLL